MKHVLILRHATAVRDAPRDRDRVLAEGGREQMRDVAGWLAAADPMPDLALVSPAARTRETWALAGLRAVPVRFEPAIYEASVETLLRVIGTADAAAGSLLLVGHNPGLEELALGSLDGRNPSACERELRRGLPTAALVVLAFTDAEAWPDVRPGTGRLVDFRRPGG